MGNNWIQKQELEHNTSVAGALGQDTGPGLNNLENRGVAASLLQGTGVAAPLRRSGYGSCTECSALFVEGG